MYDTLICFFLCQHDIQFYKHDIKQIMYSSSLRSPPSTKFRNLSTKIPQAADFLRLSGGLLVSPAGPEKLSYIEGNQKNSSKAYFCPGYVSQFFVGTFCSEEFHGIFAVYIRIKICIFIYR